MAAIDPELLIGLIAALALLLVPLASRLIADVGAEVSAELDGGRSGSDLRRHLDRRFGPGPDAARRAEIRQLLEARAYRQAERGEPPLDVEAELQRLLQDTDT